MSGQAARSTQPQAANDNGRFAGGNPALERTASPPKQRIGMALTVLMLGMAAAFWGLQVLLSLTVALIPLAMFIGMFASFVFFIWFLLLGVYKPGKGFFIKFAATLVDFIVELIPLVDDIPVQIAEVLVVIIATRIEDTANQIANDPAKRKKLKLLSTAAQIGLLFVAPEAEAVVAAKAAQGAKAAQTAGAAAKTAQGARTAQTAGRSVRTAQNVRAGRAMDIAPSRSGSQSRPYGADVARQSRPGMQRATEPTAQGTAPTQEKSSRLWTGVKDAARDFDFSNPMSGASNDNEEDYYEESEAA